jgi:hypothetical protein
MSSVVRPTMCRAGSEIRQKLTGKLLTLDESLKPTAPALLSLLDVPVETPRGRRSIWGSAASACSMP